MSIEELIAYVRRSGQHTSLYHFTDQRNVPGIRREGALLSMREARDRGVAVPAPGGNRWSLDADEHSGMDRYVHLCFMPEHGMEWTARQEGRIAETAWLRVDPLVLGMPSVMITADVSNKAGVVPCSVAEAETLLDLQVIYERTDWRDPAIQDRRKLAKKYEILIPRHLSIEYITSFDG